MDFARRQMLKYGWSEGKGLGKNESGIAEAIKPKLKFDTTGVGHDSSEQFTFNWWENVYNHAADNINVVTTEQGSVSVKRNTEDAVDITTKKYSLGQLKKKNKNMEYGSFLKTAKLTAEGVEDYENKILTVDETDQVLKTSNLTDEELFAACGGRTAHKGARHGLKLNGKLARIEEQEMLLLKKMKQRAQMFDTDDNKSKSNESENRKQWNRSKKKDSTESETNSESNIPNKNKIKTKKRKHSQSENDEFIELAAARKRIEYCCEKQLRKTMKIRRRREEKKISKMAVMFENSCVVDTQQDDKDDGFIENIKKKKSSNEEHKKHSTKRKKKRKLNTDEAKNSDDDGFEEYISEVNEKLILYKELRKELQNVKKKGDEKRMLRLSEDFEKSVHCN